MRTDMYLYLYLYIGHVVRRSAVHNKNEVQLSKGRARPLLEILLQIDHADSVEDKFDVARVGGACGVHKDGLVALDAREEAVLEVRLRLSHGRMGCTSDELGCEEA